MYNNNTSTTSLFATTKAPHSMAELSGVVKPKRSRRKQSELLRPFECETCFKHYATKAALSLHFKLKHEGAAPLKSWSELQQAVKSGQFIPVNTERLSMAAAQQQHANAALAAHRSKLRRRERHSFEPTTSSNTVSRSSSSSEDLQLDAVGGVHVNGVNGAHLLASQRETILNTAQQQRQLQQLHSAASDVDDDAFDETNANDDDGVEFDAANNENANADNNNSNNAGVGSNTAAAAASDSFVKPTALNMTQHTRRRTNSDAPVTFDLNNFGTYAVVDENAKKISLENLLNGCVDVQNLPRTENLGTELRWKRLPRFYSRDDGVSVKDEDAAATLLFELACRNKPGVAAGANGEQTKKGDWRRQSFVVIS